MEIIEKLGLNATFFVQVINFVIIVLILAKVLYKPLFKTIEDRNERIKKGLDLTAKLEKELADIEKQKQVVLKEAQDQANKIIISSEDKAKVRAEKIITETKTKAEGMLSEYEQKMQIERKRLETEFDEKVHQAVRVVVKKVLHETPTLDQNYISKVLGDNNAR